MGTTDSQDGAEPIPQHEAFFDAKRSALEAILGPMADSVGHAVIPFPLGGALDMHYFTETLPGTGFATMELIQSDGSGPQPNRTGTFELVAFTQHEIAEDDDPDNPFHEVEHRICTLFTTLALYANHAVLNPGETCEIPTGEGGPTRYLVFDRYDKPDVPFEIEGRAHGLLLCIEIFCSEMEYAMEHGSEALIAQLMSAGHYPYSDMERDPVA